MNTNPILLAAILLAPALRAESTRPLLPVPVNSPAARLEPTSDPQHFLFAVGGDNRAAGRHEPMPPTAPQIFSELRLLQPALCLWTGDAIYGSDDTVGEARAEYAAFLDAAAVAATPLFNAPGNHEISDRRELEEVYEKNFGRLYGSFDYGNSHFIAIDTEEAGRKVGVTGAQLDWLRQDLAANRAATNVFVFSHHPLFPAQPNAGFPDPVNRDEVHHLFVEHHVNYVFSGHEHLFHQSVHDGIHYVVTGGGGAPSSLAPEDGGFQHYLLVTVNEDKVSLAVLEPWRLFVQYGPVQADGTCHALVSNYHNADFSVVVEFPTDALGADAAVAAAFTYKSQTHPVAAAILPAHRPGTTLVSLTVPRSRTTEVALTRARK